MRFIPLICFATVAGADPAFDVATLSVCLDDAQTAEQRQACIGKAADHCITSGGGSTTVGMGYCLDREWMIWDKRLNAAFGALRAKYKAFDAEDTAAPPLWPALQQMQRDWIAYRDATCDFEARQWGGGSGGGPAYAGCLMALTGQQALYLEDWVETP